jgi:hypothetical protein
MGRIIAPDADEPQVRRRCRQTHNIVGCARMHGRRRPARSGGPPLEATFLSALALRNHNDVWSDQLPATTDDPPQFARFSNKLARSRCSGGRPAIGVDFDCIAIINILFHQLRMKGLR